MTSRTGFARLAYIAARLFENFWISWVIIWSGFLTLSSRLAWELLAEGMTKSIGLTKFVINLALWPFLLIPQVLCQDLLRKAGAVCYSKFILDEAKPAVGPSRWYGHQKPTNDVEKERDSLCAYQRRDYP